MAKQSSSKEKVTRIKTTDRSSSKASKKAASPRAPKERRGIIGYFVGAWRELRLVHWPTRRATWSLTGAVLAFAAFFGVFILLLDALFKYLFELILK